MLGGPRFLEILSENAKPESSEDDEVESGEGQGLDAKSSLRGSSSALTGVGAAHHQAGGSGTGMGHKMTVNPQDLDALPAYQAHETEEDSAPLLQHDAAMNDGLGLRTSIEDEGIDMSPGYNSMNLSNQGVANFTPVNLGYNSDSWNFGALDHLNSGSGQYNNRISGTGSEIDCNDNSFGGLDDRSDIVQHDSSADEASLRGRMDDFDSIIPMDDDGVVFEDPSPVPDVDDENQVDTLALHRDLIGAHRPPQLQFHAPAEDEEIDEPAAEIHLEPSDELELKMD